MSSILKQMKNKSLQKIIKGSGFPNFDYYRFKGLFMMILAVTLWTVNIYALNEETVEKFVKESGVPTGSLALKIIDLSDGSVLASHNTETPLIPASIMKSVTTASLLDEVGTDYRYHTRVYIDGPVDMGILKGNVIIVGSCDPSLNSSVEPLGKDLVDEIAEMIHYLGIIKIEGGIVIDESEFAGPARPQSWQQADFRHSYGTGSHAFNFNNNSTGNSSIENPDRVFISLLEKSLNSSGVIIEGKELYDGPRTQILDHLSPPMDEIMRSCMMRSDNLFAESMLRTFGKVTGRDGSTDEAAKKEMQKLKEKHHPMNGVTIVDGSGLSRENRVTADFMSSLLQSMSSNPDYASFFPLAGQEGTLKKFLAGSALDSYIAMKTGSMNGIQCYAGYKLDDDYAPTHVVVIIMNDMNNRAKARQAAEKMLLEIFNNG